MMRSVCLAASLLMVVGLLEVSAPPAPGAAPPSAADLAGTWAGTMQHDGESQPIALHVEPSDSGRVVLLLSLPVAHLDRIPLGRPRPVAQGDSVRLGPFRLHYDAGGPTLSGTMPSFLVPVYGIPFVLRRTDSFAPPPRAALTAPLAVPVWTFEANSALWAGPTFAAGRVYAGAEDGSVHALDAHTGERAWSFRTSGRIRTRPTVSGRDLFVPSDDGYLYKLDMASGDLRWKVRIVEQPIERLPFDDPRSRFDRFGSDVVAANGRLFVGTHDGKLLALDARDGSRVWAFAAGDAVLAAPAVSNGRVVFGSYDRFVYAIDANNGRELWRRDTRGAVVSTPTVAGDLVIVGNRAYDLLALDARTGSVAWKRYIWMSWVESSATLRDGVAYVGSSDAAAVFAVDAASGRPRWTADVRGWAWGQPAVTATRVYAGTSSQVGYLAQHSGGVLALDRATGIVAWRYASAAPDSGPYGFPGSPALGGGLVFVGGLDGRLVALRQ